MAGNYLGLDNSVESNDIQSLNKRMKYLLSSVAVLLCILGLSGGGVMVHKLFASWQSNNSERSTVAQPPKSAVTPQGVKQVPQGYLSPNGTTPTVSPQPTATTSATKEIGIRQWE